MGKLSRQRRITALLLASSLAYISQTSGYLNFERLRIGVVRGAQAASGGSVTTTLPDLSPLAGQPVAFVLRLSNEGTATRTVRIAVDDEALATVALEPDREVRVDLSLPDGSALTAGDLFEITSDGDEWSLAFLEVANVHGFSRGAFEFMVVPAAGSSTGDMPILLTVALFVLVLLFPGYSADAVRHRVFRAAYLIVAGLACLFLAAVGLAPWVSGFAVLLSWHTFAGLLVLLYYPTIEVGFLKYRRAVVAGGISLVISFVHALPRVPTAIWARRIPLLYLGALVLFVVGVAGFHEPEVGFTRFIRFDASREALVVPALRDVPRNTLSSGYDGQFYAQLAVDPLVLEPSTVEALDNPFYRARRVLTAGTAFLFGLGQPRWIVHAYAIQNVAFWILLALLLTRWLPPKDFRNFCLWFGCLFGNGVIASVVRALPDLPSLLLLALTVLAIERRRTTGGAALVGLAGLAKETNLVWSTVLCDPTDLRTQGWRKLAVPALLGAGPLALWVLYLWGADVTSGRIVGARNFAAPFTAYLAQWGGVLSELREGVSPDTWLQLFALISLTTQAVVLVALRGWANAWWRAGIASCALMVVLGTAVWGGYPVASTRVLLPMTVAFNVLLPPGRWFWPAFLLGNLTIVSGLESLGLLNWPALLRSVDAVAVAAWLTITGGTG